MTGRPGRVVGLVRGGIAVGALAVAVWCWSRAVTTSTFAPVAEGAPAFTSTALSGSWTVGATAAVIVAGLAVIVGRRPRYP